MSLSIDSFLNNLAKAPIKPVYLIAGAEALLVQEAADALRQRLRENGYSERIVIDADAGGFDWNDLHQHGASMSLFATLRLLDLRLPTGKPGKEGAQALLEFCQSPPADTVLLVTSQDWSNKHGGKWSEAIETLGELVVAWPIKPGEIGYWINRRLSAKGIKADAEALQILTARVEGNLLAANQEIDKLAMQGVQGAVTAAQMQQWVADSSRFDVFKLIDACYERDFARASRILRGLRAEGEQIPALVPMVGKELLNLAYYARIQEEGRRAQAAMQADKLWQAKQAQMLRMLDHGSSRLFDELCRQLADVDRMSKGRIGGDPWVSLERVLVQWADAKSRVRVSVCT
ncbi:DNA polymerase III subunit delta [Arenimonas sp.]|jgi:DNA polymerase-3 subunit delta|uniref:DNA polymerase III subunit delta n=1 Tax=Arenimonas sp. TaxID=1872635 RepID=UPI0037C00BD2